MLKAFKYRIYPTEEQKKHFVQSMGCVRYIYNKGLETKTKHHEATGKNLSFFDLAGGLLKEEKKDHEWLKVPYSQSLQAALRNLDTAYTNFFRKTAKFPTFKKRNNSGSLQYPQGISVDFKNKVWVPKVGNVFCRFDRKFDGKIKTCTVSKTPTDKYFISILVDNDQELPAKPEISVETSIGIDLGLKDFATFSNGEKISNPRHINQFLNRLKVLQKRASRKVKGSNNRKNSNLRVAILYETISNKRNDFLHKLSTRIVSENQTIILEDLNVAGLVKNHKLARSIADVSWSRFVEFLKYKSEWYGKNLFQIGRFEPSSKICSDCGWKNEELTLRDRVWTCKACRSIHDRDINAAINIKKFGLSKSKSGQELTAELAEIPSMKSDRRRKKPLGSS